MTGSVRFIFLHSPPQKRATQVPCWNNWTQGYQKTEESWIPPPWNMLFPFVLKAHFGLSKNDILQFEKAFPLQEMSKYSFFCHHWSLVLFAFWRFHSAWFGYCSHYDQLMQQGTRPPPPSKQSLQSVCIYWLQRVFERLDYLSLQSVPFKFLARATSTTNGDSCKVPIIMSDPCPAEEWLNGSYLQTQLALLEPFLFWTWHKEKKAWQGKQSLVPSARLR